MSGLARGQQRSTYFLQLPYRFALPLMLLSGVLHWLVSQSIFLVSVDFYETADTATYAKYQADSLTTCGYSPIAIISVLILGICMVVGGIGIGYWKFRPHVHLVGSSSAAISAACHVGGGEEGRVVAVQKVMWGVVQEEDREMEGVGHCAFSGREVTFPVEGRLYAGL